MGCGMFREYFPETKLAKQRRDSIDMFMGGKAKYWICCRYLQLRDVVI